MIWKTLASYDKICNPHWTGSKTNAKYLFVLINWTKLVKEKSHFTRDTHFFFFFLKLKYKELGRKRTTLKTLGFSANRRCEKSNQHGNLRGVSSISMDLFSKLQSHLSTKICQFQHGKRKNKCLEQEEFEGQQKHIWQLVDKVVNKQRHGVYNRFCCTRPVPWDCYFWHLLI